MIGRKREVPRWLKCQFCQSGENPDYKKVDKLHQFISDRGKIIGRTRSGICAKHQRRLAKEIKKARYLALLPFVTKV